MKTQLNQKQLLIKWLKQEVEQSHNAETFSRNGESTDFDSGVFYGREELAKELISIFEHKQKFKIVNNMVELKTDELINSVKS